MTVQLDNVSGAEFAPSTGASMPYKAPRSATTDSQQTDINALKASVLALANAIRTVVAGTIAVATSDKTILCDATNGQIVLTLPAANTTVGQIITAKKIDSSANAVKIRPASPDVIDGATQMNITSQWTSFTFQSNGTAWFVI